MTTLHDIPFELGAEVGYWQWRNIIKRDRCPYCGLRPRSGKWAKKNQTIEHIEPLSRGGEDDPTNIVGACSRCNGTKSDRLLLLYLLFLREEAFERAPRHPTRLIR